jgi:hypothetical protein
MSISERVDRETRLSSFAFTQPAQHFVGVMNTRHTVKRKIASCRREWSDCGFTFPVRVVFAVILAKAPNAKSPHDYQGIGRVGHCVAKLPAIGPLLLRCDPLQAGFHKNIGGRD